MGSEHIVFFGRTGVGTTTVAANVAAALAEAGRMTVLVGCSSRADGTASLLPTTARKPGLPGAVTVGFKGMLCLEAGKCDSRGFRETMEVIARLEEGANGLSPEFILYDLSGESEELCPLLDFRNQTKLLLVSTAEVASLRTINTLLGRLVTTSGSIGVAGIIGNNLHGAHAEAIIDDYARNTAIPLLEALPHSLAVTRSAFFGETVIDSVPRAHQAHLYRQLAHLITTTQRVPSSPLDPEEFVDWAREWADRLYDYSEGLVDRGGAI